VTPLLENMKGYSFPRAFQGREKFLYLGKFFMRNLKDKPGGGSFTGTFERKRKCISGLLFLDPEDIES
jgi:hypothetical protein